MSLTNIKKMQSERGFTIVELLIVVVIIGILAAIIIVAYTGITNRAKQSAAAGTAATVQKKVEAYNADGNGVFPATFGALGAPATASWYISEGNGSGQVNFKGAALASSDSTSTVNYYVCTPGYAVEYWDAVTGGPKQVFGGGATAAIFATAGSCTLKTT